MWRWNSFDPLWQDTRYALRMMRRSPGFTTVAILSLALGIGANTATFSLVNSLMLRTLPVSHPEQLVEILQKYPAEPRGGYFSWAAYEHYRDENHVFSDMIPVSGPSPAPVRANGLQAESVTSSYVDGHFFPFLGLKPAIGRLIAPGDDVNGASGPTVAVVSWSYWNSHGRAMPGERLIVGNAPVTVIGVAPRGFEGLVAGSRTDIWVAPGPPRRAPLTLLARLKPGVSIEQARAEMAVLFQFTIDERVRGSQNPLLRQLKSVVEPAGAGLSKARDEFAKPLLLIMGVCGMLLLIACANIASLLLARGAARQREIAVRISLGAGRFRLVRQALTESLLLSGIGSALGVFIAYFYAEGLVRALMSARRLPGPRLEIPLSPDVHMLLFTAGIALLTAALFGLAPALHALRSAPASALREMGKAGETRFRRLFGKGLVVAQVALSIAMLSAAGLFIAHLSNLRTADLGFRRDHVLLVGLDPSHSGYTREQLVLPYQNLLIRLQAIPGVRSAAIAGVTPLSGAGASRLATIEGHPERPEDRRYLTLNAVGPKYFETLGIPFLSGRDFRYDDRGRPRVAIINRAMARYFFGDGDPLGKRITFDNEPEPCEIVGVVGDAKYYEIRETTLRTVYLNTFQTPGPASQFILRTNVEPAGLAPEVRRTVAELLSAIPVTRIRTLDDQIDATIVPERLIAALSGLFGGLGAVLAAIGLYGLLAYSVARRIVEIGVRIALGASYGAIIRMVLGEALIVVSAGLAVAAPIALLGRRLAARLVEDAPVDDPAPLVFGAIAIIAVALLASYAPARRAARVDPMVALRQE